METIRWSTLLRPFALLLALAITAPLAAQGLALPQTAEDCLMCHEDAVGEGILHGPHAVLTDSRTGFAEHGCASCHGSSEAHQRRPERGQPRALADISFGPRAATPLEQQNAVCADCHRAIAGLHWQGSAHETAGLGCVDCHRLHTPDPMDDALAQSDTCFGCHAVTRSETLRPSSHPLRDGNMACSDCHDAHGGTGPALLKRATLNESCHDCHADLRGPFLWEHPPAREDCSNCHRPHGSVHAPLLTQRTPWLCQQCHMAQFHPSAALSGTGLPGDTVPSGSQSMLGRDCMNCHAQVHGSNHPSGAGQTR